MPPTDLNEQQAADLLRRAAQLQARADETHGPGLTMDEVKRAAQAAGIDPAYVEQAALGAGADLPPSAPFLGMQTGSRRTRIVPGRVSDAEWGRMVATLRRQLGGTGEVESIGGVREWRRDPYHLLLEPEGETTRITATARWRGDAVGAVVFTALLVVMGVGVAVTAMLQGDPDGFVLTALFGAMALVSGIISWPRLWSKGPRIDAKLDRALDALEEIAGREEREAVLAEAPEIPETGRMDPSLLDDPARLGPLADPPEAEGPGGAGRSRLRG